MENVICTLIAVLGMISCIITLIHNIREDRKSDRLYAIEDCMMIVKYKNVPCKEKTEHCDYCGTDDCANHPNND